MVGRVGVDTAVKYKRDAFVAAARLHKSVEEECTHARAVDDINSRTIAMAWQERSKDVMVAVLLFVQVEVESRKITTQKIPHSLYVFTWGSGLKTDANDSFRGCAHHVRV